MHKSVKSSKRKFRQLSNVEHVRLRTGMWLGQNSLSVFEQHFFTKQKDGTYSISHQEIQEVPAKLKCLDEACMNAIDEYKRTQQDQRLPRRKKMTQLKVTLLKGGRRLRVEDNGRGIPAKNAEAVFLHLMYGENFDDQNNREQVAGQNGVGISLVRIVSSYFYVETTNQGVRYQKCFTPSAAFKAALAESEASAKEIAAGLKHFDEQGNLAGFAKFPLRERRRLSKIAKETLMEARLQAEGEGRQGTLIEFELEGKYFNHTKMEFEARLARQYCQELAMTNPGLEVIFRASELEGASEQFCFKKGMKEILAAHPAGVYHLKHKEAKAHLTLETFVIGSAGKSLTWVNSNFASLGGSAVEYLENRLCDEVRRRPALIALEKRLKLSLTRNDVRSCFHFYNNFSLLAPRFKSQDKSYLINDLAAEVRQALSEHIERLTRKLDLVNKVRAVVERRVKLRALEEAAGKLKKATRTLIPKFIPCASRSSKEKKTLFIAEGDSALAGLRPVRNPHCQALFPLRGKPLNVKGVPLPRAMENEELKNLIAILKLPLSAANRFDPKTKQKIPTVTTLSELPFQRVGIITDADYDGYAIRSLMMNFFFEYWPELFALGFVHLVETPLYEVELENQEKKRQVFYCLDDTEYEALLEKAKKNQVKLLRKKRNKGLGESSRAALAYALENGITKVTLGEYESAAKMQQLWFDKAFAAERRKTISKYAQLFFEE